MLRTMVKAKIHRATVTQADLNYVGSLTIDADLMEICDILPNEQIHIVNVTNGHRMVTYAIVGERGSGVMCLNGAAARHGQKGDIIIAMTYAHYSDEEARALQPKIVVVDEENRPIQVLPEELHGQKVVTTR
ncbi:MAG: aspartate 1-decarboxylase [Armatimonadetes bacterium]|nr:aspartate 1-decarboxylase [Armatimonadota bacterium]